MGYTEQEGINALEQLYMDVRELWMDAGRPKYRQLAKRANSNKTTVGDLINGKKLPSMDTTVAIVKALNEDEDEVKWKAKWKAAKAVPAREGEARRTRQELSVDYLKIAVAVATLIAIAIQIYNSWPRPAPGPTGPQNNVACARVISATARVYRAPNENASILKIKYQGNEVTLYPTRPVRAGIAVFRAVRTPANDPGYAWIKDSDIKAAPCKPKA